MNSDHTFPYFINLITCHLNKLSPNPRSTFIHGEMTAYVETLEVLQLWPQAHSHGLDYDIERRYKI